MRITNTMLVKDMLWNSNNNLVAMSKKQTELSTGKKIHRPSDDPVGITQVLKYKTDIRETQQYQKNIDDSLGWLEVSESSLMNIKDILQRMRELAVKAANGTNTAADRDKIKSEISELRKEVLVSGNATSAGRYIFSGLETNKKLFADDGSYNIDLTSERNDLKHVIGYEVAVGEVMSVGVHPVDLFGIVNSNNFFDGKMVRNTDTTGKATQTQLVANVNLNYDFSAPGNVLDITINGSTYNVDESLLNHTPLNPMTKDRLIAALSTASDGVNQLGNVADIYFDLNNQLVIGAKNYGAAQTITDSTASAGFTTVSITAGTNGTAGSVSGLGTLTDADVLAESGKHQFVVQVDDVRRVFTVDFSTLSTVADLQTEMQNQVDAAFLPAGTVTVSAVSGGTIDFSLSGTNDGKSRTISTDYVVANSSEMITDIDNFINALATNDDAGLQIALDKLDLHLDKVMTVAGEIGGKSNRVDFIKNRVEENEITFTGLLSKIQDVDMAEAIMFFKNLENVYRASLSVGSKVIQPSLVDFIR